MKKIILALAATTMLAMPALANVNVNTFSVQIADQNGNYDVFENYSTSNVPLFALELEKDGSMKINGDMSSLKFNKNYNAGYKNGYKQGDQDLVDYMKEESGGLKPSQLVAEYLSKQDEIDAAYVDGYATGYAEGRKDVDYTVDTVINADTSTVKIKLNNGKGSTEDIGFVWADGYSNGVQKGIATGISTVDFVEVPADFEGTGAETSIRVELTNSKNKPFPVGSVYTDGHTKGFTDGAASRDDEVNQLIADKSALGIQIENLNDKVEALEGEVAQKEALITAKNGTIAANNALITSLKVELCVLEGPSSPHCN